MEGQNNNNVYTPQADQSFSVSSASVFHENHGTKVFVTIYFGAVAILNVLASLIFPVIFLLLTGTAHWTPFVLLLMPGFTIAGGLMMLLSIYPVYLFFKVRTLSLSGWLFGFSVLLLGLPIRIASSVMMSDIARVSGANLTELAKDASNSSDPAMMISQIYSSSIIVVSVVVDILLVVAWILLRKKFENSDSKISRTGQKIVIVYTVFALLAIVGIYGPQMIAAQEEPFIGYSSAGEALGKNPIQLEIPKEYKQTVGQKTGDDGKGFVMIYSKNGTVTNNGKVDMIVVSEMVNESPENVADAAKIKNLGEKVNFYGGTAWYLDSPEQDRHVVVVEKNGIFTMIIGVSKKSVPKEVLLKIAKSAK